MKTVYIVNERDFDLLDTKKDDDYYDIDKNVNRQKANRIIDILKPSLKGEKYYEMEDLITDIICDEEEL